jgi:hypothetical protein
VTGFPSYLDEPSDDDFLSGEGAVESGARIRCPYCGVLNELRLDLGTGSSQEYVQDCEICRRPWQIRVLFDNCGRVVVEVSAADDS